MKKLFFAAGIAALALASPVNAQQYPNKPINIVVPFPAGGMLDALARGLTQNMSETLGQPFIILAKPGANTMLGAEQVVRAPADGYNILFATDATVSINPLVYSKMSYDAKRDLIPVSIVAQSVETIIVPTSLKVSTLAEFVALAKAQPGKLSYATFGMGSNAHLAAEKFKLATSTDIVHVPYKGVAEALQALITDQVQILFTSQAAALPHIEAGRLRSLAVLTTERQQTLPGVPTIVEAGLPDLVGGAWFGLMVRAGTAQPIVDRLVAATQKAVTDPIVRERAIVNMGLKPVGNTPAEFRKVLEEDVVKYSAAVKAANLKLD